MRSLIRHPTDIPIEVQCDEAPVTSETLRNVSRGGLCFRHAAPLAKDSVIRVRIGIASPPFEARCRVLWCQADGADWELGVEFLDPDDLFRARMVEQICHIEQYRREMYARHGRSLSGREAALEWIAKYAAVFPNPEQDE